MWNSHFSQISLGTITDIRVLIFDSGNNRWITSEVESWAVELLYLGANDLQKKNELKINPPGKNV